jgi:hypothetical protein
VHLPCTVDKTIFRTKWKGLDHPKQHKDPQNVSALIVSVLSDAIQLEGPFRKFAIRYFWNKFVFFRESLWALCRRCHKFKRLQDHFQLASTTTLNKTEILVYVIQEQHDVFRVSSHSFSEVYIARSHCDFCYKKPDHERKKVSQEYFQKLTENVGHSLKDIYHEQ